MRYIRILSAIILLAMWAAPAGAQPEDKKTTTVGASDVKVYYFHYSRRCATCINVEEASRNAVQELYGSRVIFDSLNLEDKQGEEMGEMLGISGQTLLIVGGDKKIDITNQGFLYANSNPGKLKQVIKEKIDPLL